MKNIFYQKVWNLTSKVPKGKVTTYKEIAKALDCKSYRLVGQALKNNQHSVTIPCYRVVKSNGEIGGYGGSNLTKIKEKIILLKKDGIEIKNNKINLEKYLFRLK